MQETNNCQSMNVGLATILITYDDGRPCHIEMWQPDEMTSDDIDDAFWEIQQRVPEDASVTVAPTGVRPGGYMRRWEVTYA